MKRAKLCVGVSRSFAVRASLALGASLLLLGCSQESSSQSVRALQSSGETSFVCRGSDGTGRDIGTCPQEHNIYALITQIATGEVAVVNAQSGQFTDVDPSVPGFTFLRVGGRPGDIVSTPGGVASFVGVGDVGREGIFALPTTCLGAPEDGEERRDITTWPACSLPVAPGEMTILIAPPAVDGKILDSCGADATEQGEPLAASRSQCSADLREELNPPGRRKLAVTLPELGQIAIIDAQAVLDREPGSFDACPIDVLHTLEVGLPAGPIEQPVPADLQGNGCIPASIPYPPATEPFQPLPGGIALSELGTLYVADRGAPVVHVLDVANPCQPLEMPPLLPVSFHSPARVVTTRDVAVSPLTRTGQRFVYAIDEFDQPTASLMAFDVSVGSTSRTPIVRTGATRLPFEEVDRIRFNASVRDLQIVKHDQPIEDASGVTVTGELCDPDPENTDQGSPGVRYRTSPDYQSGAGPRTLRGIFGLALLTNSLVSVVDIEDFDAPCRRPVGSNPDPREDFRGCAADPDVTFTTNQEPDGTPTVSNEVSCRVVQPHRNRAATYAVNSGFTGGNAPSLRGLPRLSLDQQDITEDPNDPPRILAVDFATPAGDAAVPAQVYVGNRLFTRAEKGETAPDNELVIDPHTPSRYSVTLPFQETRAYASEEIFTSTYEGSIASVLTTGIFNFEAGGGQVLADFGGAFCSRGVQDVALTRELGQQRFGLEGERLESFAHDYSDYVQVRASLLAEEDSYWQSAQGRSCGGFNACSAEFGVGDESVLKDRRDLRILEAYQDRLVVEPRARMSAAEQQALLAKFDCCFPGAASYSIRASKQWVTVGSQSGFRHQISPVWQVSPEGVGQYVCRRDCDPRRSHFESRAFELTSKGCNDKLKSSEAGACVIGRDPKALVCSYDDSIDGEGEEFGAAVPPFGPGSECIFENLTARFAIYRGRKVSRRDMEFSWTVYGGFTPLGINLAQQLGSATVLPMSMVYQPQLRRLVVVDGETMGIAFVGLNSLRVLEGFQ